MPETHHNTSSLVQRRPDVVARVRVRGTSPKPRGDEPDAASAAPVEPAGPTNGSAGAAAVPNSEGQSYDVGYRKPPMHTRYRKGQSGNPKGRPKNARGLKTLARELLTEKVSARTMAGTVRMTRMQAALHKVSEKAFIGDLRALQMLISLYSSSVPDELLPDAATRGHADIAAPSEPQDVHDDAVLAALREMLIAQEEAGDE